MKNIAIALYMLYYFLSFATTDRNMSLKKEKIINRIDSRVTDPCVYSVHVFCYGKRFVDKKKDHVLLGYLSCSKIPFFFTSRYLPCFVFFFLIRSQNWSFSGTSAATATWQWVTRPVNLCCNWWRNTGLPIITFCSTDCSATRPVQSLYTQIYFI